MDVHRLSNTHCVPMTLERRVQCSLDVYGHCADHPQSNIQLSLMIKASWIYEISILIELAEDWRDILISCSLILRVFVTKRRYF